MKIAFFVRELNNVMGGMERQMLTIAKSLIDLGHSVTVFSLDEEVPELFYANLAKGIEFRNIPSGNPSEKQNLFSRVRRQNQVYQKIKKENFDVSIAFMTGAYWYSRIPTFLCGVPLILAERNAPSIYRITRVRKIKSLLFLSMIFSSAITVQFERYVNQYPFYLRHKIKVIPNIVQTADFKNEKVADIFTYVFAGRFSYQKQPLLLIKAFIEFSRDKSDVQLVMFGKGDLAPEMVKTLAAKEPPHSIKIFNPTEEPGDFLKIADVLCIPSIWEGFPNVLAEALSSGVPGLGFSNCDGVSDLIQNGVNGWTLNGDGSTGPLIALLESSYKSLKSNEITAQSCKLSVQSYQIDKVSKQWEDLLRIFA
jgi:glycosyltransferase involved in cell wall biosynthesis